MRKGKDILTLVNKGSKSRSMAGYTCMVFLLITSLILAGCTPSSVDKNSHDPSYNDFNREVLGITHVNGMYSQSQKDFLNEGADQILDFGAKVIKIFLEKIPERYAFNSTWPEMNSFVDTASSQYFKNVFSKPFHTFIITCHSAISWINFLDGMNESEITALKDEFYQLTKHFLQEYQNTNKTFIFQNWEGDWLVRGCFDRYVCPPPESISGMIAWLEARQAGIQQAKDEIGEHGVWVYQALEINLVYDAMKGNYKENKYLVNEVLPNVTCDLASYSSYDTAYNYIKNPESTDLTEALDYIADKMPDSPVFGDKNVYIGEFGCPENKRTPSQVQDVIQNTYNDAYDWGCPYIVYWQLYCNELQEGATLPVTQNNDVNGFWLIRPDGSHALVWDFLKSKVKDTRKDNPSD